MKVNGEVCTMRGKKCRAGDIIELDGQSVETVSYTHLDVYKRQLHDIAERTAQDVKEVHTFVHSAPAVARDALFFLS